MTRINVAFNIFLDIRYVFLNLKPSNSQFKSLTLETFFYSLLTAFHAEMTNLLVVRIRGELHRAGEQEGQSEKN